MAVNWGLAGGGNNALAMFGYGAQLGDQVAQRQRERKADQALATYATNPDAPNALAGVIQADPRLGIQLQGQQQERAAQQTEQRRADLPLLTRLLDHAQDPATYQQARQIAQQYGVDISSIPEQFDPQWVEQQRQVLHAMQTPQGQEALSNAGKQAVDLGYVPGTPEFNQVAQQLVEAALAQPYTGPQGETRLYRPQIGNGSQLPQRIIPQRPEGLSDAELISQAHEAVRGGANVEAVFRQLQAWGVNP